MTHIYWKDLVVNEKDKKKNSIWDFKEQDMVEFYCQICGKPFSLKGRVFKRRFDKNGYFNNIIFACQSKECVHKKKSMVGHSKAVLEGQKRGAIKAAALRKGKTFQELYGVEEAEKKLEKIRAARAAQTGTEHDPRLCKKHSEAAKIKMRKKKIDLWNNPEKIYTSPLTGEKVEYRMFQQHMSIKKWNAPNYNFYVTGTVENWYTKTKEKYDSSFERAYMEDLNKKKLFWHKNTFFGIPYIKNSDKKEHYYVPDIIIYTDNTFIDYAYLIEIKPEVFIKANLDKLNALNVYCKKYGIKSGIITEKHLNMDRVKEIQNENKKNYTQKDR